MTLGSGAVLGFGLMTILELASRGLLTGLVVVGGVIVIVMRAARVVASVTYVFSRLSWVAATVCLGQVVGIVEVELDVVED